MSTQTQRKADNYLTEGRIKVIRHDLTSALLEANGSKVWLIEFHHDWTCSCPSTTECAHILAAKTISPLRKNTRPTFR